MGALCTRSACRDFPVTLHVFLLAVLSLFIENRARATGAALLSQTRPFYHIVQARGSLVRAVYACLERMGRGEQKTSLSDRIVSRFPTVSLVEHVPRAPSESEDNMVKLMILWNTPEDPVAFERYYRDVHIPLAKQMPGLRRYTIGRHMTALRGGEPSYWIAELEWDSMDALQKALQSPQGQATAQDADKVARVGNAERRSMVYEVEEV
jgi:uncharacterized protein (TIGR02118 family)